VSQAPRFHALINHFIACNSAIKVEKLFLTRDVSDELLQNFGVDIMTGRCSGAAEFIKLLIELRDLFLQALLHYRQVVSHQPLCPRRVAFVEPGQDNDQGNGVGRRLGLRHEQIAAGSEAAEKQYGEYRSFRRRGTSKPIHCSCAGPHKPSLYLPPVYTVKTA